MNLVLSILKKKMFFVVYFVAVKKLLVVPKNWIYDSDKVIEKFMNYALNSNQIHLCYYNKNVEINGEIQPANFNCSIRTGFQFDDGLFEAKIYRYFREFDCI